MTEAHEEFSGITENVGDEFTRRRIEANAKAVVRSRRIRWTLRYTILICGAIIAALIYFNPKGAFFGWLGALSFVLLFGSGVALFCMGGLAPGSTRKLLSEKQRRQIDD